jgi:hypothetical protein
MQSSFGSHRPADVLSAAFVVWATLLLLAFSARAQEEGAAVTLNWEHTAAPSDIGFRVQWSTTLGEWDSGQLIDDPAARTHQLTLPCGPTYFAVSTLSTGDESALSNAIELDVCVDTPSIDITWPVTPPAPEPTALPRPVRNTQFAWRCYDVMTGDTISTHTEPQTALYRCQTEFNLGRDVRVDGGEYRFER